MPKPKTKRKRKPTPKRELTAKQIEARQKQRSQSARKAALVRWSGERPPSKRALKEQRARIPTSELKIEDYADRPNPELSWAAAILKRKNSSDAQRREAGRIVSESYEGKRESPWSKLPPEERSEIARRGGVRRWEIWREEQAMLAGKQSKNSGGDSRSNTGS